MNPHLDIHEIRAISQFEKYTDESGGHDCGTIEYHKDSLAFKSVSAKM